MLAPVKLLTRLLIISAPVLWFAHHYQRAIVEPMLPLAAATLNAVDDAFTILSLDIDNRDFNEVIRLRANLSEPVIVGGRKFYPLGWGDTPKGWYQVHLTAGGAIGYSVLALIVVLAWPASRWQEMLKRVIFCMPLMLLLFLANIAITFPAELWKPMHDAWVPDITWPLLVASRLLMGGGGLVLGLLCGALSILVCRPVGKGDPPGIMHAPQKNSVVARDRFPAKDR